jgi:four helix bundle protein
MVEPFNAPKYDLESRSTLSKKDFRMRLKICRKEAKEASYWLRLLYTGES